MIETKIIWFCTQCGYVSYTEISKCPKCNRVSITTQTDTITKPNEDMNIEDLTKDFEKELKLK